MKKSIGIMMFAIIVIAASCKKDDNSNPSTSAIITSGSWRITYFHESSDDHTNDFNGYTFTFDSNGQMTATHPGGTVQGTWSKDDSSNELHFSMGNNSPCDQLNKGWLIIEQSSTLIKLRDDNLSSVEELHFSKN